MYALIKGFGKVWVLIQAQMLPIKYTLQRTSRSVFMREATEAGLGVCISGLRSAFRAWDLRFRVGLKIAAWGRRHSSDVASG